MTRSLYSDLAGSGEHLEVISDEAFLRNLLKVEEALATGQGPETVRSYTMDFEDIARRSAAGGNPVIPLVKDLKAINPEGIHPGATSQDIIDTALMICMRDVTAEISQTLQTLIDALFNLTVAHRETPIMGRTLGQAATPTTFGAITGGWLVAMLRAQRKLKNLEFPVSYGGASGNMTAAYPHGWEVQRTLARKLDLVDPGWVWHSDRTPITEIGAAMATVSGVVRKMAGDIIFYSQTEVGELREKSPGGSSAMPHKANPAAAIACDGYARRAPGLVATLFDALDCRLQRGTGSWHAEWATIRELAAVTHSAVSRALKSVDGIIVNVEAMAVEGATGHATEIADRAIGFYEGDKNGSL